MVLGTVVYFHNTCSITGTRHVRNADRQVSDGRALTSTRAVGWRRARVTFGDGFLTTRGSPSCKHTSCRQFLDLIGGALRPTVSVQIGYSFCRPSGPHPKP